jgi:hypothetical protein
MVWAPKEVDFFKSFKGRCYLTICVNHLGSEAFIAIMEELQAEMTETMRQSLMSMAGEDVRNKAHWKSELVRRRWAHRKKERTDRRAAERAASREQKEAYDFEHTLFDVDELKSCPDPMPPSKQSANWGTGKRGAKWKCDICKHDFAPGTSKTKHKLSCGKGRSVPRRRRAPVE